MRVRDRSLLAAAVDGVDCFVEAGIELVAVDRARNADVAVAPQPLHQWLRKGVAFRLTLERSRFDLAEAREDDDLLADDFGEVWIVGGFLDYDACLSVKNSGLQTAAVSFFGH